MQVIRTQIDDMTPVRKVVGSDTYKMLIYLDGRKINDLVTDVTIDYSSSSFHNTISFNSLRTELYGLADPLYLKGQSRIEVQITEGVTTRVLYFLVEERSGSKKDFSVWGRDITARENKPYSEEALTSISSPQLASSIAAGMLTYSALTWEAHDYLVYEWEYVGVPIEGVKELASEIGAIVRAEDDGSITVRPKKKVRPCVLDSLPDASGVADVSFTDAETTVKSFGYEQGTGANQIVVKG